MPMANCSNKRLPMELAMEKILFMLAKVKQGCYLVVYAQTLYSSISTAAIKYKGTLIHWAPFGLSNYEKSDGSRNGGNFTLSYPFQANKAKYTHSELQAFSKLKAVPCPKLLK